jgi:hypothetical protein
MPVAGETRQGRSLSTAAEATSFQFLTALFCWICSARSARCVQTPAAFNEWNENEDMISFFLASIHAQLQQAYVGLALALSAGRPFVLPKVRV